MFVCRKTIVKRRFDLRIGLGVVTTGVTGAVVGFGFALKGKNEHA